MSNSVLKQIADLENRTHEELKVIWRSLYGAEPPAYNRQFIIKRLSYRIQELRHGGLSPLLRLPVEPRFRRSMSEK